MLGSRIALMRQKAGLSQAALAAKIHVSPSAIGMYEQGRREPSTSILALIARELQVSTDYLLNTGLENIAEPTDIYDEISPFATISAGLLQDATKLLTREELAVLCMACLL